jgi:hypothetical protein
VGTPDSRRARPLDRSVAHVIQRFCFVKLHDHHVEGRGDFAVRLRAEFAEAGAEALIGVPADHSAAKWDASIAITAASAEAWHALAKTPKMIEIFDDITAHAKVMKQWTFDVGGDDLDEL